MPKRAAAGLQSLMAPERRYHFRLTGLLFVAVTILIGIGAVNSQNNLLFIAFGLALGALLVSGFFSGSMMMGLRARREAPASADVGEPLVIRFRLRNRNRLIPAFALWIDERYPRAERARAAEALSIRSFVVHVGPRQEVAATAVAYPKRRGELRLEAFRVMSSFPFGVFGKSVAFRQPSSVLVRPERAAIPKEVIRRAMAETITGVREHRHSGRGLEYLGLREYTPGDSARQIAWRASARRGALVVKETAAPSAARLWIGLDLGAGRVADEESQEEAIRIAAGLIETAARAGAEIGLVVPEAGIRRPPTGAGRADVEPLLNELARIDLHLLRSGTRARLERGAAVLVAHAGPVDQRAWPASATLISARTLAVHSAPNTPGERGVDRQRDENAGAGASVAGDRSADVAEVSA